MAYTLTVELCNQIFEIASNGGEYRDIDEHSGVTRQAISQWYRNSVGEEGTETFKGETMYQLLL